MHKGARALHKRRPRHTSCHTRVHTQGATALCRMAVPVDDCLDTKFIAASGDRSCAAGLATLPECACRTSPKQAGTVTGSPLQ